MKHQAMNPYLPLWEYVPDGEPHVFGDRLYLYGSHDIAGSTQFCEGDYVVWSAPLDDLGDWKYEGISYPYTNTSASLEEGGNLAAPDCARGADGRYYLYYNRGRFNACEVAVSDTPQGPFTYLCNVAFPDGTEPGTKMFDPGVLVDEDGRVFLYIECCRQGCAEPVTLDADGRFHQAEMTSCGLNGGPLAGTGCYNACYACNLTHETIGKERLTIRKCVRDTQPHIFEESAPSGKREDALHYIANMQEGTLAGFKYFALGAASRISLRLRASAAGHMTVWLDEACTRKAADLAFEASDGWLEVSGAFEAPADIFPLFFRLHCPGKADWESFTLI